MHRIRGTGFRLSVAKTFVRKFSYTFMCLGFFPLRTRSAVDDKSHRYLSKEMKQAVSEIGGRVSWTQLWKTNDLCDLMKRSSLRRSAPSVSDQREYPYNSHPRVESQHHMILSWSTLRRQLRSAFEKSQMTSSMLCRTTASTICLVLW